METEDFNKTLAKITDDFIQNWVNLVDTYASKNELGPNHKLCVLLFSHLGLERKMAQKIWDLGSNYMNAVITVGEERKANA